MLCVSSSTSGAEVLAGTRRERERERERAGRRTHRFHPMSSLAPTPTDGGPSPDGRACDERAVGSERQRTSSCVRRLDRGVRVGLVCQTTPQNVCNKGRCIVTGMTPLEKSANNAPHKRRVKTGKRQKPRVDLLPSARQLELIGQHESHRGRPRLVDSARDN